MRLVATVAVATALGAGLFAAFAFGATPPDLTGSWFNPDDPSAPAWALQASSDRKTLTATWRGGRFHETLRGSFSGTVNADGSGYTGTMQVSEAGISPVGGTMSFHIDTPDRVTVTYHQDNNVGGTFALERKPTFTETATAATVSGSVLVQLPGTKKFVALGKVSEIPVGSIVDTRHGRVRLTIVTAKGLVEASDFYEGEFLFTQPRKLKGIADLRLVGGNFGICKGRGASAAGVTPGKSVRHLWGNGAGLFRTTGRYSSATIRGTTWLTDDRCNGTLTRVTKGSVVVRDLVRKKSVVVKAPRSYFAAARR